MTKIRRSLAMPPLIVELIRREAQKTAVMRREFPVAL